MVSSCQSDTRASLYLHVLQASEQRLVGLTHLLLVPPHVFQRLLNLLLFPLLRQGEKNRGTQETSRKQINVDQEFAPVSHLQLLRFLLQQSLSGLTLLDGLTQLIHLAALLLHLLSQLISLLAQLPQLHLGCARLLLCVDPLFTQQSIVLEDRTKRRMINRRSRKKKTTSCSFWE